MVGTRGLHPPGPGSLRRGSRDPGGLAGRGPCDGGHPDRLGCAGWRRVCGDELVGVLGDGFFDVIGEGLGDRDGAQACQGAMLRDAHSPGGHAEGVAGLLGR